MCTALTIVVAVCLSCGKNSNESAPQGVIQIITAIDSGDQARLKALLEGGAAPTPNESPLSPIHAAITHFTMGELVCDSKALKLLLDHGADPNFIDRDSGFAPLEDALAMGDMECVALLRDAGASFDAHGHSGQSILQFAVKGAVRTGDTDIIKEVLSWGVDPNVLSTRRGFTALHEAAWGMPGYDAIPIITELLQGGVDPCIPTSEGQTPLDIARNLKRPVEVKRVLANSMAACPPNQTSFTISVWRVLL